MNNTVDSRMFCNQEAVERRSEGWGEIIYVQSGQLYYYTTDGIMRGKQKSEETERSDILQGDAIDDSANWEKQTHTITVTTPLPRSQYTTVVTVPVVLTAAPTVEAENNKVALHYPSTNLPHTR